MNSKKVVSISTKQYFEGVFYFSGWTMIIISIPVLFSIWWASLIVLLIGLMIITTQYRINVDLARNKIEDYTFFLGMKSGNEISTFSKINYILLKKSNYRQQLNHQAISSSISGFKYTAYLSCDDQMHFLGESENYSQLRNKMDGVAVQLNTEINFPD